MPCSDVELLPAAQAHSLDQIRKDRSKFHGRPNVAHYPSSQLRMQPRDSIVPIVKSLAEKLSSATNCKAFRSRA